jgi:hypothetical protein
MAAAPNGEALHHLSSVALPLEFTSHLIQGAAAESSRVEVSVFKHRVAAADGSADGLGIKPAASR